VTQDAYLRVLEKNRQSWVWWLLSVIPAFGRLWKEDGEFQATLSYIVRSCFKPRTGVI
jgi:hypothetical protein